MPARHSIATQPHIPTPLANQSMSQRPDNVPDCYVVITASSLVFRYPYLLQYIYPCRRQEQSQVFASPSGFQPVFSRCLLSRRCSCLRARVPFLLAFSSLSSLSPRVFSSSLPLSSREPVATLSPPLCSTAIHPAPPQPIATYGVLGKDLSNRPSHIVSPSRSAPAPLPSRLQGLGEWPDIHRSHTPSM